MLRRLPRVRRTELATLGTIAILLVAGAFIDADRAGLMITAAVLAVYDLFWFHLVPPNALGRRHFAIGTLVTQAIGVLLLALTGGAGSNYFTFYVLAVLASALRPNVAATTVVGTFAVLAYLALALVGPALGTQPATRELVVGRGLGLAATAIFIVLIVRALERSNAELATRTKRLDDVIRTVQTAVVTMDQEGRITGWNPEAERTFGWSEEEILGRTVAETLIPERYRKAHWTGLRTFLHSGEGPVLGRRIELEALHADGSELPVELTIAPVPSLNGWSFTALLTDISARRRRIRELEEQATQDPLTGLANRRVLYDRLEQLVDLASRHETPLAVLLTDLDGFKRVNDVHGHDVGDEVLRGFGRRMAAQVRESDTVARLGGDEFACVLPGSESEAAEVVAAKILAACEAPVAVGQLSVRVRPSIGIACYPKEGRTAPALLHASDVAMYRAKREGAGFARYPGTAEALEPPARERTARRS